MTSEIIDVTAVEVLHDVDPQAGTIVWPNGADVSAYTLYQHSSPGAAERAS